MLRELFVKSKRLFMFFFEFFVGLFLFVVGKIKVEGIEEFVRC